MNLQTPKSASSIAEIKASSQNTAPVTTTQEKAADKPTAPLPHTPKQPPVISAPPAISKPDETAPPAYDSAASSGIGMVNESDIAYLRAKKLLIPVVGVSVEKLRDSFYDERSEGRIHRALDIMASAGTPVLASADGKVKCHTSARGGIMMYVTDPSAPYVYYYGHLQRYADGIYDGKSVRRGEVIAYVGDTGNAGVGNFHLHFGISKVSVPGKWTGGEPINPYPLLTGR